MVQFVCKPSSKTFSTVRFNTTHTYVATKATQNTYAFSSAGCGLELASRTGHTLSKARVVRIRANRAVRTLRRTHVGAGTTSIARNASYERKHNERIKRM